MLTPPRWEDGLSVFEVDSRIRWFVMAFAVSRLLFSGTLHVTSHILLETSCLFCRKFRQLMWTMFLSPLQ
ncbi:hypothetical protein PISMIDRAFT_679395 [Pisolithus microcarpus 441]|uniref:Uncharacterized protein n=1 Tax=Pisolithus microcarpus 441 TaxID=765257 RepID=A0A0C9ZM30_9AGAM|nr:hypothetical protein PISMIDRAFT_679395 [Pisolithus microcarpus 441]